MCVDRRVARSRRLRVRRVIISRDLIFVRGRRIVMILEHEIRELIVRLRRLWIGVERGQKLPVPARGLDVVGRSLFMLLRVLVLGVIVVRQILQVALQVTQHFGRLAHIEVMPVLALQAVCAREVLLRREHELRESALLVDFAHPHAEARRRQVERVRRHE